MADSPASSQWWFRAAGTEKVYGPVSPEALLGWAREGRIYPEDKVSSDNASWGDARQLPFLAMDTVIVRPDGLVLGPFHRDAVDALRSLAAQIHEVCAEFFDEEIVRRIAKEVYGVEDDDE